MAMKIALFTAAFSSYPIERAFEAAAKYGYDGIEIGGFRPTPMRRIWPEAARRRSASCPAVTTCPSSVTPRRIPDLPTAWYLPTSR